MGTFTVDRQNSNTNEEGTSYGHTWAEASYAEDRRYQRTGGDHTTVTMRLCGTPTDRADASLRPGY